MSVTQQVPRNVSTAAPGATVFPYNFKIPSKNDLLVTVNGVAKLVDADYTVSGVGLDIGGDVTFIVPLVGSETVVRKRNMDYKRDDDYQSLGDLRSFTLNNDQDAPVMMLQQVAVEVARSLRLPDESTASTELPPPVAMNLLGWSEDKTALVNAPVKDTQAEYAPGASGSVPRLLLYKLNDTVSVKDFGAVGDGGTNDQLAFQSAMDYLGAGGGGTLLIPPGTYVINGLVVLRNNIDIRGDGATITKTVASSYTVFASFSNGSVGYASGAQNVSVSGIRFLGSFASGLQINPFGFNHASNVTVERCIFDRVLRGGHVFDLCGCENITIRNNVFLGFDPSTAPTTECIQVDVSALGAVSAADTPGSYDLLLCRNIVVDGNKFLPVDDGGTTYPCPLPFGSHTRVEGRYHENLTFTNNLVVDPPMGVSPDDGPNEGRKYGVLHLPTVKGVLIAGNTFKQTTPRTIRVISIHSMKYGVAADFDPNTSPAQEDDWDDAVISEDIVIRDNTFDGFNGSEAQEIIWLHGHADGKIKNVVIEGNRFSNGYVDVASLLPNASAVGAEYVDGLTIGSDFRTVQQVFNGVLCDNVRLSAQATDVAYYIAYFDRCVGVTVQGCTFSDYGRDLQTAGACSEITVVSNTFRSPKLAGVSPGGIAIGGTTSQFVVSGNTITASTGTPARGILLGGSVINGVVTNNVVTGFTAKVSGTGSTNVNIPSGTNY